MAHVLTVTPFLWLHHDVLEVADFYARVLPGEVVSSDSGGTMQSATIRLGGQTLHLFNAGPMAELTAAFSLMVTCSTQDDIDRLWDGLLEGGQATRCGWLTDRYGVTWQIVPERLQQWLADSEHGHDVTARMLEMVKLEIAPLEAALRGD
jgi:predicted 3-demethylubiquinone-9 3-methyltransferase (glyoxalase superfamily)